MKSGSSFGLVVLLCLAGSIAAQQTLQSNCGKDPCEKVAVKKAPLEGAKEVASDRARVPLKHYVPLVGEEVYDPKKNAAWKSANATGRPVAAQKN